MVEVSTDVLMLNDCVGRKAWQERKVNDKMTEMTILATTPAMDYILNTLEIEMRSWPAPSRLSKTWVLGIYGLHRGAKECRLNSTNRSRGIWIPCMYCTVQYITKDIQVAFQRCKLDKGQFVRLFKDLKVKCHRLSRVESTATNCNSSPIIRTLTDA